MINRLVPVPTTDRDKLRTEVEQRTTYTLSRCELNIFETHRKAEQVKLTFDGFTITSMLRGKKIVHVGNETMNYTPGETFMLQSASEMVIDFPEANYVNPTQCTALVLDDSYLRKQLEYINETFPRDRELGSEWQLNPERLFLQNDEKIAYIGTHLIRLFSGNDPMKDILVDIKLKELMLSIMRLQHYHLLDQPGGLHDNISDRFRAVVEYIRKNITANISPVELSKMACMSKSVFYRAFTNEFGIPPAQMVLQEKIRYAKRLLASENMNIKEVCFAAGFSDPNYFSRAFRKIEGMSPGEYKNKVSREIC